MSDKATQLEEWKARYESYRAYRSQYLNVLSIVATGFVIGLGLAFGKDSSREGQIIVLTTVSIGLLTLVIAHRIFAQTISSLGNRIKQLEDALEMEKFETTKTMASAIAVTRWVTTILLVIMFFLLVLVLMNKL